MYIFNTLEYLYVQHTNTRSITSIHITTVPSSSIPSTNTNVPPTKREREEEQSGVERERTETNETKQTKKNKIVPTTHNI